MDSNVSVSGWFNGYHRFMEENSDPTTRYWFMLTSPAPVLAILLSYYYFCTHLGPKMMKERQPFSLKSTLIVYNLVNVAASVWLVYEGLMSGWLTDYNYNCQPMDYSDSPQARRMANACWLYFICKIVELLETVFFVLRKKDKQVSYLHMYHHMSMPFGSWIVVKFVPGGQASLIMVMNSFVHAVMYSYYLLAALGPQFHKYLWWKRYLTSLQLLQFVILFLHQCQVFVFDCNYPKVIAIFLAMNTFYFFYLFGQFYVSNYTKQKPKAKSS